MEIIFVYLVFGAITAAIANSKGRNTVAWFFLGAFLFIIALIILLCLPNLKEQQAKEERLEQENRRIREQVRQEQMRLDAFRRQTNSRLDRHDHALEIDTSPRAESPLGIDDSFYQPPALPGSSVEDVRPVWFYVKADNRCGPVSLSALRALYAGGEVDVDTLFWTSGMGDWLPGRSLPKLQKILRV